MVIEASGGTVETRRRRDVTQIKECNPKGQEPSYIIISCEHDLHLVADVLKAKIGIYNSEFVLTGVLRQEMDFDLSSYIKTT